MTNGIELDVGDTLDIRVAVLDQVGNVINYIHPNANLVSGDSATYLNGVLTAISPEAYGTIIFSFPGFDDLEFNFTIKSRLNKHTITFVYGNGEQNSTSLVI